SSFAPGDQSADKRHFSSLLQNRQSSFAPGDQSADKRHFSSLLQNRQSSFAPSDQSADKRHFSSLLQNRQSSFAPGDQSADKRHFSSLLQNRQSSFAPSDQSADKRHFSSLLQNRQSSYAPSDQSADKRHFSSLLQNRQSSFAPGDQSADKRHFSSLLQNRQSSFTPDKRHLGSLFQNRQMRFTSDTQSAEKRHLGSLLHKRETTSIVAEDQPADEGYSSQGVEGSELEEETANHPRRKRYIGSLAKSNNMPYPYSRSRQNRRDAPNTPADNAAYLERLIRMEIQKGLLRKRQRQSLLNGNSKVIALIDSLRASPPIPDSKRSIQSLARNGNLYMHRAYKRGYDSLDDDADNDYFQQEDDYTDDDPMDDNTPQHVTVNKRFLGSLARSSWFPRRYRGGYSFDLRKRVSSVVPPPDEEDDDDVDEALGDNGAFFTYSY
ncbi:uncharacterized protein LOC121859324, partial [Homarus americanus]|uniref:uncharacterized protein LOC121859324 n=1 Tax=Homarus americanus TaxID=6706 RepID=UPI001C437B6F